MSHRYVEALLAERGVEVDHVTIYQRVRRFTPLFIEAARPCRHVPRGRWCVNETYVKVGGRRCYLYRAVDQAGQVLPRVPDELLPAGRHVTERHANNPIEIDHSRRKAYIRPMRGL